MASLLGLIAETHGAALRALCEKADYDGNGLSQVARVARRRHLISPAMAKKLERLDATFAISRHLTVQRSRSFLGQLQAELYKQPAETPAAPATPAASQADKKEKLDAEMLVDGPSWVGPEGEETDVEDEQTDMQDVVATQVGCDSLGELLQVTAAPATPAATAAAAAADKTDKPVKDLAKTMEANPKHSITDKSDKTVKDLAKAMEANPKHSITDKSDKTEEDLAKTECWWPTTAARKPAASFWHQLDPSG